MVSNPEKCEWPPLLDIGFHRFTLDTLRQFTVAPFPGSKSRERLFQQFEQLLDLLSDSNATGDLWIDGSYLTQKESPNDVDVLLVLDGVHVNSLNSVEQMQLFEVLAIAKTIPGCDFHCCALPTKNVVEDDWQRAYWLRQWGFSRRDVAKGIAVLGVGKYE